jgi:hypothetical protein
MAKAAAGAIVVAACDRTHGGDRDSVRRRHHHPTKQGDARGRSAACTPYCVFFSAILRAQRLHVFVSHVLLAGWWASGIRYERLRRIIGLPCKWTFGPSCLTWLQVTNQGF